ncbi:unnamed protein product [Hymenolepis diminuta]|uniref:Exonuclease domain-containing protein n=1 Tax=Hymenolepis diminuta TaxID=6216 RepID=A0A564ZE35_HYMDI|nr:unnamed protein product [Hymenolepis diminuta]
MSSRLFSTFIFFDTETSGLPIGGFHPRITELSLLAIERSNLIDELHTCPFKNKLSICFNPMMPIQSQAKDFDDNALQLITCFLHHLTPPICIVAHNGYNFDFPLLKSELTRANGYSSKLSDRNGDAIFCSDSLHLFRDFDYFLVSPDDKGLAKSNIYERVFCKSLDTGHTAEGDCMAMIKIVRFLGEPALFWFDVNCKSLADIPLMYEINNADPKSLPANLFPHELD